MNAQVPACLGKPMMRFRDLLSYATPRRPPDVAGMAIPEDTIRRLRDSDHFLISYPRSGNRWVRHLISDVIRLTQPVPAEGWTAASLVPDLHPRNAPIVEMPEGLPRIFKSHNLRSLRGRKIAYLFREPADSLISYFHYLVGKNRVARQDRERPDEICLWLLPTWIAHVRLALEHEAAFPERTFFASYEMLFESAPNTLLRLSKYFGLNPSPAIVDLAVERNQFSRLRAREEQEATDGQAHLCRKGRPGSGREELRARTVRKIEREAMGLYEKASEAAGCAG